MGDVRFKQAAEIPLEAATKVTADIDQVAKAAARGLSTATGFGAILTSGLQSDRQGWMAWAFGAYAANVRAAQALAGCRSPSDVLAVQTRLIGDQIALITDGGKAMSKISFDTTAAAKALVAHKVGA